MRRIVPQARRYYGEKISFDITCTENLTEGLRFVNGTNSAPTEDSLWSFDEQTNTLTLKDGFELSVGSYVGISLSEGVTIVVEGNAKIESLSNFAISSLGDLTVKLKPGACLELSGYEGISVGDGNLTVIGEADEDGNHPTIKGKAFGGGLLCADNSSEQEGSGVLTLSGLNVDAKGLCAVVTEGGEINITDCDITATTDDEAIINVQTNGNNPPICDITIKDSRLNITSYQETIENQLGGIVIENTNAYLTSRTDTTLSTEDVGDVKIKNSAITAKADMECICVENGELVLEDVNLSLHAGEDCTAIHLENEGEIFVPGVLNVFEELGGDSYTGEWQDNMSENGVAIFVCEEGEGHVARIIRTMPTANTSVNVVEGVKEAYDNGEKLEFTTMGAGEGEQYPVHGFERFKARKWEILDTELSGFPQDGGTLNSVDISTLLHGTYTLRVTFEMQRFSNTYWGYFNNPTDEMKDIIEVEFTITEEPADEPADEPVDEPTEEPADEPSDEPIEEPETDDENKPTGTTASLALAGIALAAVVMVATKKRK